MSINNLNAGEIATQDQVPFFSVQHGQDRKASVSELLALATQASATTPTQYAAPSATGFIVTIAPFTQGTNSFLLLAPAATYAAGTIVLPEKTTCTDGQEALVTCTQIVTALTVSGNGAAVNGAPSTLAANGFFKLRYDAIFGAWYRIG